MKATSRELSFVSNNAAELVSFTEASVSTGTHQISSLSIYVQSFVWDASESNFFYVQEQEWNWEKGKETISKGVDFQPQLNNQSEEMNTSLFPLMIFTLAGHKPQPGASSCSCWVHIQRFGRSVV